MSEGLSARRRRFRRRNWAGASFESTRCGTGADVLDRPGSWMAFSTPVSTHRRSFSPSFFAAAMLTLLPPCSPEQRLAELSARPIPLPVAEPSPFPTWDAWPAPSGTHSPPLLSIVIRKLTARSRRPSSLGSHDQRSPPRSRLVDGAGDGHLCEHVCGRIGEGVGCAGGEGGV